MINLLSWFVTLFFSLLPLDAALETAGPPPYLVTLDRQGRLIRDIPAIVLQLAQLEGVD